MNGKILFGTGWLALAGVGCTGVRVEFENAPVERLDLARGRKVMGKASSLSLFEIIPIGVNDRQLRAYENLKADAGCDYVTDIRIKDSWTYVWIGLKYGTVMTGTAYPEKTKTESHASALLGQTLTQKLEELKKLRDNGLLTEAEYDVARRKAIGN